MFLEHKPSGNLVEILNLDNLADPCIDKVMGRFHAGEELQEIEPFTKSHLMFPSGEPLPQCWLDAHYREHHSTHQVQMA
ncbi:MAG: acetyltransferase [Synechococcales cyanobacterium T60_A2020_003]|nr:acetyltransferase [Synechococcales cyanobacterium T60_A2020_003]